MYSLVVVCMSMVAVGLVATGLAMELSPAFQKGVYRTWSKPNFATNLVLFVGSMIALFITGGQEALATEAAAPNMDIVHSGASIGLAVELIAVSLPTLTSVIAAGIAVSKLGTAGLAVVAEKPEIFGRTLIYLGLAEGLAIYGLVLSILMMGKL